MLFFADCKYSEIVVVAIWLVTVSVWSMLVMPALYNLTGDDISPVKFITELPMYISSPYEVLVLFVNVGVPKPNEA